MGEPVHVVTEDYGHYRRRRRVEADNLFLLMGGFALIFGIGLIFSGLQNFTQYGQNLFSSGSIRMGLVLIPIGVIFLFLYRFFSKHL